MVCASVVVYTETEILFQRSTESGLVTREKSVAHPSVSFRPTVVAGFFVYYCQIFAAKFAFLQERGAYLALNNR